MNEHPSEKRSSQKVEAESKHRKRKIHQTREGISKLKAAKRLSLDDSLRMANNLGKIARRAEKRTGVSIRKVFISALGEAVGESLYKKRKTVMLYEDETPNEREIRKTSDHYIALAKQLYRELSEDKSANLAEERALGDLIEGTTFESRQRPTEKMHQEAILELERQLYSLVESLEDKVDLDWMYAFVKANKIGVDSKHYGSVDNVTLGNETAQSPYHLSGQTLSWDKVLSSWQRHNNIAPCVRIAKFYVHNQVEFKGWVLTDIDLLDDSRSRSEQIRQRLARLSGNEAFLAKTGLENHSVEFCSSTLEAALGTAQKRTWMLDFDTAIDLEVLYDDQNFRWFPVFLWRNSGLIKADEEDIELVADETLSPITNLWYSNREISAPPLLRLYEDIGVNSNNIDVEGGMYAVLDRFTDYDADTGQPRKASYFVMEPQYGDEVDHICPFHEWPGDKDRALDFDEVRAFRLNDPVSSEALLSQGSEDELKSALDLGSSSHGFTPAPYNSLANFILSNLAYAPAENRLDQLLVADARNKFGLLAAKAEKLESEFRSGLERVRQARST